MGKIQLSHLINVLLISLKNVAQHLGVKLGGFSKQYLLCYIYFQQLIEWGKKLYHWIPYDTHR